MPGFDRTRNPSSARVVTTDPTSTPGEPAVAVGAVVASGTTVGVARSLGEGPGALPDGVGISDGAAGRDGVVAAVSDASPVAGPALDAQAATSTVATMAAANEAGRRIRTLRATLRFPAVDVWLERT